MKCLTELGAALLLAGATMSAAAAADVEASGAWARATVPGQTSGTAFLTLRASAPTTLIAIHTPAAKTAELHQMVMNGSSMTMRPVGPLALSPGQSVTLDPAGMHIMLFDLAHPLVAGQTFPLTLDTRRASGTTEETTVTVTVRALGQ